MRRVLKIFLVVLSVVLGLAVIASEVLIRQLAVPTFVDCGEQRTHLTISGFEGGNVVMQAYGCSNGTAFVPRVTTTDARLTIRVPADGAARFAAAQDTTAPAPRPAWSGDKLVFRGFHYERVDAPPLARIIDAFALTRSLDPWDSGFADDGVRRIELPQPSIVSAGEDPRIEFDLDGIELDDTTSVSVQVHVNAIANADAIANAA